MAPGDIVKVRLQCQTESKKGPTSTFQPKYRGPVHCLLSILKEDGVRGLYRGALPLMLRDGPSYGLYFLTYRTVSELLTDFGDKKPSECEQKLQEDTRENSCCRKNSCSTAVLYCSHHKGCEPLDEVVLS